MQKKTVEKCAKESSRKICKEKIVREYATKKTVQEYAKTKRVCSRRKKKTRLLKCYVRISIPITFTFFRIKT